MTGLRFTPLGVGDAFSSLYYSSCLAVEAEGARLLIDCPHPIRKMLREASLPPASPLDVGSFAAVVVTHLHADHASGLEGFGYFSYFVLRRKARLYMHPAASADLWHGHLKAGMGQLMPSADAAPEPRQLPDFFDLLPLDERCATVEPPFRIECRRTIHHVPTVALRIHAGGRCLAYSADTAFDPSLIDWLSEADLVIHETNLGVHTPYERLAALPEALRAKMRLIHYTDMFDTSASVIAPLRQGETSDV
jgi:ribonuclease BN (tRNA processing enzyme)